MLDAFPNDRCRKPGKCYPWPLGVKGKAKLRVRQTIIDGSTSSARTDLLVRFSFQFRSESGRSTVGRSLVSFSAKWPVGIFFFHSLLTNKRAKRRISNFLKKRFSNPIAAFKKNIGNNARLYYCVVYEGLIN